MRVALLACLALAMTAIPAPAQRQPFDQRTAVYELRTYYPAPGKLAPLNARFRNHTLKLFEKHGMRNVAYWNEQPSQDAPDGRIIYILAFPDRAAKEAAWKAFIADPEWRQLVATSEADGKLISKIDSVLMTMTDYSPPLMLGRGKPAR